MASVAAPILTALAILSKESAYALPLIALLLFGTRGRKIVPCALMAAGLFVHRWQVFGGPGGYLDAATGRPQILHVTSFFALKALVYRPWWPLLAPLDWAVKPGLALLVLLCLLYASLAMLAFTSRPSRATHLLFTAAIAASLIPPIHLALIGSDLQGTRVFYLPSIVFCLWISRIPRNQLFAGIAIVFSFCALRHNLAIRSEVAGAAARACRTAADAINQSGGAITVDGLPKSLDGVFFFGNGFQECVRAAASNPEAIVIIRTPAVANRKSQGPVLAWNASSRRLHPQP